MASRKFKQDWLPTPLRRRTPDVVVAQPEPLPEESATALLPGSALATATGSALATAAGSALASARTSAVGSALATAAGSALKTARNSELATAASSALATARDSALATAAGSALTSAGSALASVESALASAIGPIPSPVALVNRATFIIKFLIRWFFREMFHALRTSLGSKKERSIKSACDTREFAERLGGSWIILIRLVSLRQDLLGAAFCRELAKTRDLSHPVPFAQIRQTVEEDLRVVGTSFEETFLEFAEEPLRTRSFSQVHRARLKKNNQEVIVRVRTPNATERVKADQRYLGVMQFLIRQFDIEPHLRFDDLLFEVKKATDDFLDFRTEVEELRKIRKVLRRRRVYVPTVHSRFCTERVLILEYVSGVSVDALMRFNQQEPERCDEWMRENNIDPRRLWRRLFNVHQELLFEHNLFYTELQPSSVMLLKDNRLAFVNLSTIGTIDADLQRNYRHLARALIVGDYSKACDYYLTMGPSLPYKEITGMKQATQRSLRKWESHTHVKSLPYSAKSLDSAMGLLARCASKQELPAFWNMARLQLAERMLNTSLDFLNPTKSSIKALKRYERSAQLRAIKNATTKNVGKRVNNVVDAAQLSMQLLENLEHDGEYLRRRLIGAQAKLGKVAEIVGRIVMIVAKLAMVALVVQGYLYFKRGAMSLPMADQGTLARILNQVRPQTLGSWVVLILFLFYIRRFLMKLARQLFSKEVRPADVV